jgi:hypothetical protein
MVAAVQFIHHVMQTYQLIDVSTSSNSCSSLPSRGKEHEKLFMFAPFAKKNVAVER